MRFRYRWDAEEIEWIRVYSTYLILTVECSSYFRHARGPLIATLITNLIQSI